MLLIAIIFSLYMARKYNKLYYILLAAIIICLIRTCLGVEYEAHFIHLRKIELIMYMVFFYKLLTKRNKDVC